MTKTRKYILIALVLIVFIGSCFFCWIYGFKQGLQAGGLSSSMAEFTLKEMEYKGQVANANCEGVKVVLNDRLDLLEKYKHVENGFITETGYHMDRMLIHVRIARVEERLGNTREKKKHMAIAEKECNQIHWDDCSVEKMVWFSKETEKSNPINCLSPSNNE